MESRGVFFYLQLIVNVTLHGYWPWGRVIFVTSVTWPLSKGSNSRKSTYQWRTDTRKHSIQLHGVKAAQIKNREWGEKFDGDSRVGYVRLCLATSSLFLVWSYRVVSRVKSSVWCLCVSDAKSPAPSDFRRTHHFCSAVFLTTVYIGSYKQIDSKKVSVCRSLAFHSRRPRDAVLVLVRRYQPRACLYTSELHRNG